MGNSEIYDSLNEKEGLRLPSYMGIIPRGENDFMFDFKVLEKALRGNKQFVVKSFEMHKPDPDEVMAVMNFNFNAVIEYDEIEYEVNISARKTEGLELGSYSFANTIDEESLKIAASQPYYLEVKMLFDENPMFSFLFQLKVLYTIMPNSSLVIDFSSIRLLSSHWLKMTAESNIPPSPNYLYIVHAVYDEGKGGTEYWMHTHGLHRCGSMELELVGIKSGPNEMHNLINTAASLMIMEHYKENEAFQVGYDGLGINLCWLRWEEALNEFPENVLGGVKDRTEEDGSYNVHSEPSGILFAVEEGNFVSPEIYVKTLSDNPIFYIRTDETLRMSALAKERFHLFKSAFEEHTPQEKKGSFLGKLFKKKSEEEDSWQFLVKIGLLVDNAEDENQKEHLWYEVKSIDGDHVTGELLNQPYWIAGLKEGDVKTYSVSELLTDWIIYAPEANYTPDSIYMLNLK